MLELFLAFILVIAGGVGLNETAEGLLSDLASSYSMLLYSECSAGSTDFINRYSDHDAIDAMRLFKIRMEYNQGDYSKVLRLFDEFTTLYPNLYPMSIDSYHKFQIPRYGYPSTLNPTEHYDKDLFVVLKMILESAIRLKDFTKAEEIILLMQNHYSGKSTYIAEISDCMFKLKLRKSDLVALNTEMEKVTTTSSEYVEIRGKLALLNQTDTAKSSMDYADILKSTAADDYIATQTLQSFKRHASRCIAMFCTHDAGFVTLAEQFRTLYKDDCFFNKDSGIDLEIWTHGLWLEVRILLIRSYLDSGETKKASFIIAEIEAHNWQKASHTCLKVDQIVSLMEKYKRRIVKLEKP